MTMSVMIRPPLNNTKAKYFVKQLEQLWNQGEAAKMVSKFSNHCQWKDNRRQVTGSREIIQLLTKYQKEKLKFRVSGEIWSHSIFRIVASIQYEWSSRTKTKKIKNCGHVFMRVDTQGKIKEFCLSSIDDLSKCED